MDNKIEKAIEKLLIMYEKIENDLLIKIASHFSMNEEFLNSDHWRIRKLEEMGLFNQEIIEYLSRKTKIVPDEVEKALNKIGIDTINIDRLNRLFEDEVLKINPKVLSNNSNIKAMINSAYNTLNGNLIQMSNKIKEATKNSYLEVIEDAYLKTSMGTHSYQEAIRSSINELSNKGINTLTYKTIDENGNITGIRNYDIEGTARREILTASRSLSNAIALEVAKELECEFLYLSEHLQCRETHFAWQGTIIKIEELVSITHYGEIDGLGGINCRHYFEPYWGTARSEALKKISQTECNQAYKRSQQQRYLERGIRKWKRKAEMFKANDDMEAYKKCKDKVKEWQQRNRQFTEENNLRRDFNREYVSEAKKKMLPYKDITKEWLDNKTDDGVTKNAKSIVLNNKEYFVNAKNKIIHKNNEVAIAELTVQTFGGELQHLPDITEDDGIRCGDCFYKNEIWDIKELGLNAMSKTRAIDNLMKSSKGQSNNFIIDITRSKLDRKNILGQIEKIYSTKNRDWIDKIIVFDNNKLLKVTKRAK